MAGKAVKPDPPPRPTFRFMCPCGRFWVNLLESGQFRSQAACTRCDAPLRLVDINRNLYERGEEWEL